MTLGRLRREHIDVGEDRLGQRVQGVGLKSSRHPRGRNTSDLRPEELPV